MKLVVGLLFDGEKFLFNTGKVTPSLFGPWKFKLPYLPLDLSLIPKLVLTSNVLANSKPDHIDGIDYQLDGSIKLGTKLKPIVKYGSLSFRRLRKKGLTLRVSIPHR